MFPLVVQAPPGLVVPLRPMAVPKEVKWQHMLQDALNQIQDKMNQGEDKMNQGWGVAYCDGSHKGMAGVSPAEYCVWFALGMNETWNYWCRLVKSKVLHERS